MLWRSGKTGKNVDNIFQLAYRRHEMLTSDHRPVSASFQLKVLGERGKEVREREWVRRGDRGEKNLMTYYYFLILIISLSSLSSI